LYLAAGGRGAGVDLGGRPRGVWPGRAGRPAHRAVGGNRGVKERAPMKREASSLVLLTIVSLVVAIGLSAPSAQTAPQKVVFALNWFPVGDHAADWVALDKGY